MILEPELFLYGLLWIGFLTFDIVIGVRLTRYGLKKLRKWRNDRHRDETLKDLR